MVSGAQSGPAPDSFAHPILLYDGVCGLCNRMVQFILRHDPAGLFRFASLQSPLAERILARHGADAADLDAVYVVVHCDQADEVAFSRSAAVIFVLTHLRTGELRSGGQPKAVVPTFWRLAGLLLQLVPRRLRNWGYGVVARNRYRVFGRYDSCPIPSEETRNRFIA